MIMRSLARGASSRAAADDPAGDADLRCVRLGAIEEFLRRLEACELARSVDIIDDVDDDEKEDAENLAMKKDIADAQAQAQAQADDEDETKRVHERILQRSEWTLKHVLLHAVRPVTGRNTSWIDAGKVADEDLSVPGGGALVLCSQDTPLSELVALLQSKSEENEFFWIPAFCAPYEVAASGPGRACLARADEFAARIIVIDDWARPALCRDLGVIYALKESLRAKLALETVFADNADHLLARLLCNAHAHRALDVSGAQGWAFEEGGEVSLPYVESGMSRRVALVRAVLGSLWSLQLENLEHSEPVEGLTAKGMQEVSHLRENLGEAWTTETKPALMCIFLEWLLTALDRVSQPAGALYTLAASDEEIARGLFATGVVASELEHFSLATDVLERALSTVAASCIDGRWIALELARVNAFEYEFEEARKTCQDEIEAYENEGAAASTEERALLVDVFELAADISDSEMDLASALDFVARALAVARDVYKPGSGRVASLLGLQGAILSHKGKRREALALLQSAARLCELSYGIADPMTARTQLWLGLALGIMDHWTQSVEVCEVAVAHQECCYGKASLVKVCDSQQVLACAFFDASERGKALVLSEAAQQRVEVILDGSDHPARVFHLLRLGALQSRVGLWKRAAQAWEQALSILDRKPHHTEHFKVHRAYVQGKLAIARCETGAAPRLDELLAGEESMTFRLVDPMECAKRQAQQLCLLAGTHLHKRALTRSLELLDEALLILDAFKTDEETQTVRASILSSQGYVYLRLRCAELAVAAYSESLEVLENVFEEEAHHLVAQAHFALSRCYSDHSRMKNLGKALNQGQRGFEMVQELARGQPNVWMARANSTMAGLYARKKNPNKALEYLRAGIEVLEEIPDWTERELGLALTRRGILERSVMRSPRKALQTFSLALSCLETADDGAQRPTDLSEVLLARGRCHQMSYHLDDALADFRRAADIREAARGKRDGKLAEAFWRISEVLEAKGEFAEALEYSKRAARIAKKDISRIRQLANAVTLAEAEGQRALMGESLGGDESDDNDEGNAILMSIVARHHV
ncbi:Hypothetical Protein FCC1311_094812 [Hondaea fermentalgiana]|uniref:Tetratricopeptide repeat protein 28 n=1 Tax=Hondaea fermentalgiana TaxID=2315210 RepID=A0A2R5GQV2_9STRA|nr:Hypothetical Protein FCC1311_094812 [Hondaea fermentalgiana]|eukprot:GBG33257.1 Hypothetical Protein FCC1311_094812 [Hondaea fermentalgiana]